MLRGSVLRELRPAPAWGSTGSVLRGRRAPLARAPQVPCPVGSVLRRFRAPLAPCLAGSGSAGSAGSAPKVSGSVLRCFRAPRFRALRAPCLESLVFRVLSASRTRWSRSSPRAALASSVLRAGLSPTGARYRCFLRGGSTPRARPERRLSRAPSDLRFSRRRFRESVDRGVSTPDFFFFQITKYLRPLALPPSPESAVSVGGLLRDLHSFL